MGLNMAARINCHNQEEKPAGTEKLVNFSGTKPNSFPPPLTSALLAGLQVTFLMMPMEIFWASTVSWRGGDFLCRICSFFRIFGLFLSSHIVICISIDRYEYRQTDRCL